MISSSWCNRLPYICTTSCSFILARTANLAWLWCNTELRLENLKLHFLCPQWQMGGNCSAQIGPSKLKVSCVLVKDACAGQSCFHARLIPSTSNSVWASADNWGGVYLFLNPKSPPVTINTSATRSSTPLAHPRSRWSTTGGGSAYGIANGAHVVV
jgi:hypothetical protein